MIELFLFLFVLFLVFLESTITTVPITLCALIPLYIVRKGTFSIVLSFLAGALLDLLLLNPLGQSSVFFLVTIFLISLYERKFNVNSFGFVGISSFIFSLLFLMIFGYNGVLLQAFLGSIFSLGLFSIIRRVNLSRETL